MIYDCFTLSELIGFSVQFDTEDIQSLIMDIMLFSMKPNAMNSSFWDFLDCQI